MANRTHHVLQGLRSDEVMLTARIKGAGAANMVNDESAEAGAGEIVSAVRTGAGAFTLTFRNSYPKLMHITDPGHLGTTTGLACRILTWDVVNKTATIVIERADGSQATAAATAVATDPAAADTFFFMWIVRNSGRN